MASAIVFIRLTLMIAVVAWLAPATRTSLAHHLSHASVMALILWRRDRCVAARRLSSPSQLGVALTFGVIYSVILFAVAAALVSSANAASPRRRHFRHHRRRRDTLSTARLVQTGSLILRSPGVRYHRDALEHRGRQPWRRRWRTELVRQLALPFDWRWPRVPSYVLVLGAQGDILPIDASGILCGFFRLGLVQPGQSGSIVGAVSDRGGAAMANAKVTLVNEGTNFTAQSNQ
jgi:hypothetical protein